MAEHYLTGTRAAIPLAAEQTAVMMRLVKKARPTLEKFLDLGCGDGVLGRAIQTEYPAAMGVFADFSEPMLEAAARELDAVANDFEIVTADFSERDWTTQVEKFAPFDAVVSGFAIHHMTDGRKREIYGEIFGLLEPGGIFLNLEHVASPTDWLAEAFEENFVDSLYEWHRSEGREKTRETLYEEWKARLDEDVNILAPVEAQLGWLREIGFAHVDCYLKIFEQALFGGIKP